MKRLPDPAYDYWSGGGAVPEILPDPKPEPRIVDRQAEPLDSLPVSESICPFCDQRTTHWHRCHVLRRSQGGDDVPENLFWACPTCHFLLDNRRGGRRLHKRFVDYCRLVVPEIGVYTDEAKFEGWLERRFQ